MTLLKTDDSIQYIPISMFDTCKIDNVDKSFILSYFKKPNTYYLQKFEKYLKDQYNLSMKEYCIKYLNFQWPKCPASGVDVGYNACCGKGLIIRKHVKLTAATCPAMLEAYKKISKDRRGAGNPMYGKKAWNAGLDRSNPIIDKMASKREGSTHTEESRKKQSDSAKKRLIHGHTGVKHSEETILLLKENTARLWAEGRFNRVTSIHLKMRDFLQGLSLTEQFKEEVQVKYFSMDFAFEDAKVAIECQGTYFHVDPRVYPDGPINAMQRRNFGRDKSKQKCCESLGWIIIPVWETEINDGTFKEQLTCKLQELKLLKN